MGKLKLFRTKDEAFDLLRNELARGVSEITDSVNRRLIASNPLQKGSHE